MSELRIAIVAGRVRILPAGWHEDYIKLGRLARAAAKEKDWVNKLPYSNRFTAEEIDKELKGTSNG